MHLLSINNVYTLLFQVNLHALSLSLGGGGGGVKRSHTLFTNGRKSC